MQTYRVTAVPASGNLSRLRTDAANILLIAGLFEIAGALLKPHCYCIGKVDSLASRLLAATQQISERYGRRASYKSYKANNADRRSPGCAARASSTSAAEMFWPPSAVNWLTTCRATSAVILVR